MGSLGHFCPCSRAGASACLIACAATNSASITRRLWPYGPVGPLVARAAYRIKVDRNPIAAPPPWSRGLLGANDAQHRLAHESSYPGRALGDAVSTRDADTVFQLTPIVASAE